MTIISIPAGIHPSAIISATQFPASSIVGKPIGEARFGDKGLIHVYSNDSLINTKQLFYNANADTYEGKFWASKAGILNIKLKC